MNDEAQVLLAVGPPSCGKTEFAVRALLDGMRRYGSDRACMAASGRKAADRLADRVIREMGVSAQARPVTTLAAVAFRIIALGRARRGASSPRLLNGAEQDALLRGVLDDHAGHVRAGESGNCPVCGLLQEYFADVSWPALVDGRMGAAFVGQLRDMLARMDELGVSREGEDGVLAAVDTPDVRSMRLRLQWRLAFALRARYDAAVESAYPGECRLDSSRLLVEGTKSVGGLDRADLPSLVVVDDFQDVTLAGLGFLEALRDAGCRLVLVGCPDESVQSFRGSYPEYALARVRRWPGCEEMALTDYGKDGEPHAEASCDASRDGELRSDAPRYLDLVTSRVSLSILSTEDDPTPVPLRAGKMHAYRGSWPIEAVEGGRYADDGSVVASLYRSSGEETDDVVWRIKRAHLDAAAGGEDGKPGEAGCAWNDMAVIAHDNATVRAIGERLRREGVPVLYSSVTRPLKDEPFVQALFALIELAGLRRRGLASCSMAPEALAGFVRSRVVDIMNSPLVMVGDDDRGNGYPARLSVAESAMGALQSLAEALQAEAMEGAQDARDEVSAAVDGPSGPDPAAGGDDGTAAGGGDAVTTLNGLIRAWDRLRGEYETARRGAHGPGVAVDDSLVAGSSADAPMPFGRDALYLLLMFDPAAGEETLQAIHAICGSHAGRSDGHAEAFSRVWRLVADTADALSRLPGQGPQYALSAAWTAAGVDRRWQRLALRGTEAGRAANDRLDVAMRLFQFAQDSTAARDIEGFIEQVRSMEVEADSLAHVGPVEQAVTLTTPAGAAGRHFRLVWIPSVQQDVWPNLTPRNTMFGAEDLADIVLRGGLARREPVSAGAASDPRLASVLYAERRSLLVALTRAETRVFVSAVHSEDVAPSEFLYAFMPERYPRVAEGTPQYTEVGEGGRYAGLDADPRGLVAAARVALARGVMDGAGENGDPQDVQAAQATRDAAEALALLASSGVESADPSHWMFMDARDRGERTTRPGDPEQAPDGGRTVTLSPSAVDGLWACPVCWLLENRFAGPRPGSVAAGFGTLIHAVAEQASREGLDRPGRTAEEVLERMTAIYRNLRADPDAIDRPADRYAARRNDEAAAGILANIAAYFVDSNAPGYPAGNVGKIDVGTLQDVQVERHFGAAFGLDDVLEAYNAIDGVDPIDASTLMLVMGALVGGWPEAMAPGLRVRLSGRIDRLETRLGADGRVRTRLVDYKTGGKPALGQLFSDLQLVCYQLGLAFPEDGPRGAKALRAMPDIAQSMLFHVREDPWPAKSWGAEGAYQPPLFADGSLNARAFAPRYHYPNMTTFFDAADVLPPTPPDGVGEKAWEQFVTLRGTHAVWALTMISRVFYAAAASVSTVLTAHPQALHVKRCRCIGQCPACSGQIDTVFEVRQP
ncbi:ATP-dependent DNA helicase UvrD [Bifidobacterium sp. DSM 109958]|uniref:ATP-dependent DNA helicase UvrD n=1 Tax=Bifidobacterium moraviense TaxID=2675323 RepID=A0A7Y0F1W7_9BIFI|nr:PD-(D/E)XK nuclease family protein [Bifidobacterium sp. DSM 109958]NMN00524.1 ATP-dependent DNA helicase UvrD [Bifidobacterium sp. DSM 109958]